MIRLRLRLRLRGPFGAIGVAACLLTSGCGKSTPTSALGRPHLVTFGHSWVQGQVRTAGGAVTPWPVQAASRLGWTVDNHGAGGSTSDKIAQAVKAYDVSPADTVVVEPILTDVGLRGVGGLPSYARALRAMLRHLTGGTTRPAQIIVLEDPPITGWAAFKPTAHGSNAGLARYVRATNRISADYPVTLVDLGAGWNPATDLTPDMAHPSAAGTATIRDRVVRAVHDQAGQPR